MSSEPILALDPAMFADPLDSDDSDYEYEYHDTDTETIYLNLDLTALNGPIRPARRRTDPPLGPSSASASVSATHPFSTFAPENESDRDIPAAEHVQILGLHTHNPLIAYQNQIFSGTWADQVGTELFFTHPEHSESFPETTQTHPDGDVSVPDPGPGPTSLPVLKRGQNFDLIAANQVKILGRKANLISSSGPSLDSSQTDVSARKTAPPTNQSRFLDRLTKVKQDKGETDPVRTVVSLRRNQNLEERLRGWARTEEQVAEIQRLNEAAIQGNSEALAALERIYLELNELT